MNMTKLSSLAVSRLCQKRILWYSHLKETGMAHTYIVTLTPGEDGFIVAECPALPGCVSQGATREEALKNIQEAIEGTLELRKAQQLPIPSPDIVEISVAA